MDTRQLAAFCAVVERRSFSQAAERLGVTQPAVSLQVRALEKRLGTQLLDRSGRRVEPTEAGMRLFRGAQRMLQLEEQMLDEVASEGAGALTGELSIGASTGPAAVVVPVLLCEFHERHPDLRISLEVHDTQTVVDLVAERGLELGIVGAARRHRAVRFEPILEDEVILICPPGHSFAGRTITVDDLRGENLILMQEGAGVRQVVEDELRTLGVRLRDLSVSLELGLQESVRSAVQAGYGITFISRTAVESDLAAGTVAEAHLQGMSAKREVSLVRASGRCADARGRGVRRVRARRAGRRSARRYAVWAAPTTRRRLTTPDTWPSSSITGRWRKPCSSITRAASSTSVSARGGDRVDRHPLAHPRLARVNPRRHRLQQVALGEDPDQVAEVLHHDGADVLGRHPLGDLPERVLGGDLDEVEAHHVGDPGHGTILSQRFARPMEPVPRNKIL